MLSLSYLSIQTLSYGAESSAWLECFHGLTEEQGECLWTSLASLADLRVLSVYPYDDFWFGDCSDDDTRCSPFHYQGLSALTQIR